MKHGEDYRPPVEAGRKRSEALSNAARRAVRVVFGCVPLLVIAGTIEGFLSPSGAPAGFKVARAGGRKVTA